MHVWAIRTVLVAVDKTSYSKHFVVFHHPGVADLALKIRVNTSTEAFENEMFIVFRCIIPFRYFAIFTPYLETQNYFLRYRT